MVFFIRLLLICFSIKGSAETRFPKVQIPESEMKKHELRFIGTSSNSRNSSLVKALADRAAPNDFYYILLGHPHDKRGNRLQLKSYMNLHRTMTSIQLAGKAVSLNNDYPPPVEQHGKTPQTYKNKMFEKQSFVEAPSVADAHRRDGERKEFSSYFGSQDWVRDYGENKLGLQYEQAQHQNTMDFDFLGITVHSWLDCIPSLRINRTECIHIIQLRNYDHFYPKELAAHQLVPVFHWIYKNLKRNKNPTLIAFQEFDSELEPVLRKLAEKIVHSRGAPLERFNILAVLFTIMERNVTIEENLCSDNKTPIPIISFGAVPSEHYLMLQFSSDKPGIKHMFDLDASANNKTVGIELSFLEKNCFPLQLHGEKEL